jgi:hypothetical protein
VTSSTAAASGRTRTLALTSAVITALAALYCVASAVFLGEPSAGFVIQAVIHLGELAGVLALALLGAATGKVGRIGLGLAVLGQVLLVVAELTYPFAPAVGEPIFDVAPLLTGIGLVLAGIAVLRGRRWPGAARFTPLVVGLYGLVVLPTAMIVSGGPPAPLATFVLAGWELCWLAMAIGVLARTTVTTRAHSMA